MNDEKLNEVRVNNDTVLMSEILKDQIPGLDSEGLLQQVQDPWVILIERIINVNHLKEIKPFSGFLIDISDDNSGHNKEILLSTLIEDGIDTFRAHCLRSMTLSIRKIELSRNNDAETVEFDVSNYVVSGCRIGAFDYVKGMCELLLKLTVR